MNLPLEYQLQTSRLLLRRFTVADAARVCEIQSNWNVARMLRIASYPPSVESIVAWLAEHEAEWLSGKAYRFAVLFDGHLTGCCDVDEIQGNTGELGYWYDEPYWGRGFASEASGAVQRFALDGLGLKRLKSGRAMDNLASGRVLTKLGFKLGARRLQWHQPRQEEIWHQTYTYEPANCAFSACVRGARGKVLGSTIFAKGSLRKRLIPSHGIADSGLRRRAWRDSLRSGGAVARDQHGCPPDPPGLLTIRLTPTGCS
jgi:ribosomal-protein-alanine N-acetyltransferase